MKTVENLAFKGGGVLGSAYVGAYKALQEVRLLGSDKSKSGGNTTVYGNVKRVAGTSAGAIFATLVALGLTYEETEKVLNGVNFQDFVDFDPDPAADGGFLAGEAFRNWMMQVTGRLLGGPTKYGPTFGDLANAMTTHPPGLLKDLHVFAHQDWPGRTVEFCAQSTPDVPIADAVRASMSIPFIFKPWSFQPELAPTYPGLFFDGGTSFNYPVSAFDSGEADKKTLGFYLSESSFYQQGLFPELLVHMAMNYLGLSTLEASFVEAMMEWAVLAYQRGYSFPSQGDLIKGPLTDAGGGNRARQAANDLLTAVSDAHQVMRNGGKRTDAADLFQERDLIASDQYEFYKAIDGWYGAICAVQNAPTNMVFNRDASRTIFIDTLGYLYFDFWLPKWDRQNLIDSGYACTRSYLSLIMYS
jgi:predicted acylesterase/phospholipase RssA